jgi:hypothetical protein
MLKFTNKDLMIFFRKMITGYHVFFGMSWSTAARKTAELWPEEGVRFGPPERTAGACAQRARPVPLAALGVGD